VVKDRLHARPRAGHCGHSARLEPISIRPIRCSGIETRQLRLECRSALGWSREHSFVVVPAEQHEPLAVLACVSPRQFARHRQAASSRLAPTRLAAHSFCRCRAGRRTRPSRRSLGPATRGRASRRGAAKRYLRTRGSSGSAAGSRRSASRPAAASPGQPDTYSTSPGRAPSRRSADSGGTKPSAVIVTTRGPRTVSPPTSATP